MISLAKTLLQPVLHSMDPEQAHGLSILALRMMPPLSFGVEDQRLNVNVCGLSFPNPLGMAAGFDKDGEVPDALLRLGFGFAEVGSITPLAQPGNPKPRAFSAEHSRRQRAKVSRQVQRWSLWITDRRLG